MSTVEDTKVPAQTSNCDFGARRFRWTAKDYEKLADVDVFWNRRVQLINGEIIEMSPQKSPRSDCVESLDETLRDVFGRAYRVRSQLPLDLGPSSLPEPDAVVLLRRPKGSHPKEAVLVAEVSATTLAFDRRIKSDLYAQARIPEYWICNIPDRQIEVHRDPQPDPNRPSRFRYAEVTIVPADGFVSPLAKPDARIAVADLLP